MTNLLSLSSVYLWTLWLPTYHPAPASFWSNKQGHQRKILLGQGFLWYLRMHWLTWSASVENRRENDQHLHDNITSGPKVSSSTSATLEGSVRLNRVCNSKGYKCGKYIWSTLVISLELMTIWIHTYKVTHENVRDQTKLLTKMRSVLSPSQRASNNLSVAFWRPPWVYTLFAEGYNSWKIRQYYGVLRSQVCSEVQGSNGLARAKFNYTMRSTGSEERTRRFICLWRRKVIEQRFRCFPVRKPFVSGHVQWFSYGEGRSHQTRPAIP